MQRVAAHGCRMTGLLWTEGALRDVVLRDCAIDLASFAASTIEQVVFERCILRQTDFQDAELRGVRFVDCDLTDADLSGARLAFCELSGCTVGRPARRGEPARRRHAVGRHRRRRGRSSPARSAMRVLDVRRTRGADGRPVHRLGTGFAAAA